MVNILKFLFGILLFNFQIVDVFSKDNIFHEKKNLISHAGGFIDNHAYTNSIEALQNSISKGFYMIELDLRLTSDNVFVALHSWKDIEKIFENGVNNKVKSFYKKKIKNNDYSYNDIIELNKNLKYKILSQFDIEKIFSKNEKLILFIDKSNDFKRIDKAFSFNDRIIIETFNIFNFLKGSNQNFNKILLSTDLDIVDRVFIKIFNIKNLVISKETINLTTNEEYLNKYIQNGKEIFVYTVNDFDLIKKLYRKKATYFYTDIIN